MANQFFTPSSSFGIGTDRISQCGRTYFIADIGANHNGSLDQAKKLIHMCAEAGADAAKFQHFAASTIVSDRGFKAMDPKAMSHQSKWKKSVFEVYESASINQDWTNVLKKTCDEVGIAFMTTPYSKDLCDLVDPYVPAYKIGSGDITWLEHIDHIASKGKPVLLACGASTMDEIIRAVDTVLRHTPDVAILQCNTNYTASMENFDHINLNVLDTFKRMYPSAILGLSDHTPGHATALGAVALGARIVEKHFTDDNSHDGPDHKFAMNPVSWSDMVNRTRELERAMGGGVKRVEPNEIDTVVVQRRSLRAANDLPRDHILTPDDIVALRPCPVDAMAPHEKGSLIGRRLSEPLVKGDNFLWSKLV